jgi:hypothetical protein
MAMNTPISTFLRRPMRAICALGLTLVALAAAAGNAGAYVSPAQAEHAADRGANWFQATQDEESGRLDSDWAMTALAAAGINAADVRSSMLDPTAQDYYLDEWQTEGPGGAGTDAARGILSGIAGGIQTSRLSTSADATRSNLVARLAELWDGTQLGDTGLLNDDIFGLLALHHAGAPPEMLRAIVAYLRTKQLADGGWSWSASPSAPTDTDMTGSVVAAFCAAGIPTSDPDLAEALDLLHSLQDPDTGGFIAPPESFGIGVNTDTTAWVASGLIQCGIDPQGPEWTTDQSKTPFDYLLSLQRPDGHFDWTDEFAAFGGFETFNAVRPLGGTAFSTEPPARLDGVSPAVHPAPAVADGTTVPITLMIDHGPGADDVRMCRIDVASGSALEEVLDDAEAGSSPAACVTEFAMDGARLASLNGVSETPEYGWSSRVDGGPGGGPIGFGDLVFLEFEATVEDPGPAPKVDVPALKPAEQRKRRGPRIGVHGRAKLENDSVGLGLRCPRGNGAGGCRGTVTAQFRRSRGGELLSGGSAPFEVASGEQGRVTIRMTAALREALTGKPRVKLRITAATRAEDGTSVRLTHVRRFVSG